MRLSRHHAAAIVLAAALLVACGCGQREDEPKVAPVTAATTTAPGLPGLRSTDATVAPAQPETVTGEITTTLNAWWRQMRYRSAFNAKRYYTPQIRYRRLGRSFADEVFRAFGIYAGVRKLIVDEVRENSGSRAIAFIRIRPESLGDSGAGDELATVRMRLVKGHWLIDDTGFFDAQVRAIQDAGQLAAKP